MLGLDDRFLESLLASPWVILVNIIDIIIVTVLIYRFIKALAGTKIMSLVQGVVLFIAMKFLSQLMGFTTLTWLMNQVITYGVIAGVVIFTPEIRSGLERFGRTTQVFSKSLDVTSEEKLITALVDAVAYMGPRKIGALIVLEQAQTLQEYRATGIALDADVTSQLLINIFIPNTPLHDGAVIITGDKIATACSYLPLSESQTISKEFGTRHRAAIGLSEQSDALTLIVSEETGAISLAYKNHFHHDLSLGEMEIILQQLLMKDGELKKSWWQYLKKGANNA